MANYFVDREVEYPGRVNLAPVDSNLMTASIDSNGVASFSNSEDGLVADMTRAEGTVSTEGTPLNATNLNGGINQMIADALKANLTMLTMSASSSKQLTDIPAGSDILVIWSAAGSTGSRGIDYVWFSNELPVARSVMLSGTQLLQYGGGGGQLLIENSAASSTVHVTVISKIPIAV